MNFWQRAALAVVVAAVLLAVGRLAAGWIGA
jgi:hypothetical protein